MNVPPSPPSPTFPGTFDTKGPIPSSPPSSMTPYHGIPLPSAMPHLTLLDVRVDEEVMRELDGTARKKRRRWRVWTGSLGLVIAGWSLFLTCKYVYGCTQTNPTESQMKIKMGIAFCTLSLYSTIATCAVLFLLRYFHAPTHSHPILIPFVHTSLYLSSLCILTPAVASLILLCLPPRDLETALMTTCPTWGLDLVWLGMVGLEHTCNNGMGGAWVGAIAGRLTCSVAVLALFHHSLHRTFILLQIPLPSDTSNHLPHPPLSAHPEKFPPNANSIEYESLPRRSSTTPSYYVDDAAHSAMRSNFLHRPSLDSTTIANAPPTAGLLSPANSGGSELRTDEIRGWFDPRGLAPMSEEEVLVVDEGDISEDVGGYLGQTSSYRLSHNSSTYTTTPLLSSVCRIRSSSNHRGFFSSLRAQPHEEVTNHLTSIPPRRGNSSPSSPSSYRSPRRSMHHPSRRVLDDEALDLSTITDSIALSGSGSVTDEETVSPLSPRTEAIWDAARERRWGSEHSNGGRRQGSGTGACRQDDALSSRRLSLRAPSVVESVRSLVAKGIAVSADGEDKKRFGWRK